MDFFELRMDVEWYRYLAAFGKDKKKEAEAKVPQRAPHKKEQESKEPERPHNAA